VATKKKIIRSPTADNSAERQNAKKVKSRTKLAVPKTARTRLPKNAGRNAQTPKLAAQTIQPTDEQIRTRAYFISERRRRFDLPGDANDDWLEAKRQLLSQFGPR